MLKSLLVAFLLAAGLGSAWQIGEVALSAAPGSAERKERALEDLLAGASSNPEGKARALGFFRAELGKAPLEDHPLALAGLVFASSGAAPDARAAAEAVIKRNPRNRWGRAALVQYSAESGDLRQAVDELGALMVLDPPNQPLYLAAMAELAEKQQGRALVEQRLAKHPDWSGAFVAEMNKRGASAATLAEMARYAPNAQELALRRTAAEEGHESAFFTWLTYLPQSSIKLAWPYDGAFKGLPGAPPFNWRLDRNNAEMLEEGGLFVNFPGRRSTEFAAQMMLLGPGHYTLAVTMNGEARSRGSYFQWIIECADTNAPQGSLDVKTLSETLAKMQMAFTIPADGCAVQRLRFVGVGGELPLRSRAMVKQVALAPSLAPAPARESADQ